MSGDDNTAFGEEVQVKVEGSDVGFAPAKFSALTPHQKALVLTFRLRTHWFRSAAPKPLTLKIRNFASDSLTAEEQALLGLISDVEISPFNDTLELPWAAGPIRWGRLRAGKVRIVPLYLEDQQMAEQESMTLSEMFAHVIAEMDHVSVDKITPDYLAKSKKEISDRLEQEKKSNPSKYLL